MVSGYSLSGLRLQSFTPILKLRRKVPGSLRR